MMKDNVQKFGKFLSGMVMPNIGAFIAWGFITAFFLETGWWPNEKIATIIGPMLKYLLPTLIGYTGGKMVAGERGGVMGAIATIGVIAGTDITMFIGAMAIGPFGGFIIKKFDKMVEGKVPAGFEMLVNNFSIGILGMLCAIFGYFAVGPLVLAFTAVLKSGVEVIIANKLLPFISIFIEPAKVLFLNNAINHGIMGPIGVEQAQEMGKSIMFLLESNPGPGFGVLLAYCVFAKGSAKQSAPGAAIIHFFGGIHEIYFPYILMNPLLIIAPIVGSAAGILTFSLLGAGLVATPSPGSILALSMLAPKGGLISIWAGVAISTVVSFLVAAPILKKVSASGEQDLESATEKMKEMKAAAKNGTSQVIRKEHINKIVFACDAGMGSSAMGATKFRNRLKEFAPEIIVTNTSVDTIPSDADLVVSHKNLADRALKSAPNAEHVNITNFLSDPALDALYESLKKKTEPTAVAAEETAKPESVQEEAATEEVKESAILKTENILVGLSSETKEEAIQRAGELLHSLGYVGEEYVAAMQEREKTFTTYMGMGIAIPHGTGEAKTQVKKTGIVVLQYPEGVDFGDEKAQLIIGIAGVGDEHLEVLANVSSVLENEEVLELLKTTTDRNEILTAFC